ncbi:MAG TPA: PhnD/SsuA/transferrin family substrate-binding protein [Burkholderiaceae bacterium]|jgi:phosphonate transport system substrate-binding protein|nr:PhnD/SsuA/transferrin family substrate-binding protein [Burkholderiaceae bacterium]
MNPAPGVLRRRAFLAAVVAAAVSPSARGEAATEPVLRVALVPYLPARALLETWEPLRLHLAARLGQPVEMYSAASFRALVESVRRRAQDLTLVPVHVGQLLVKEGSGVWLAMSTRRDDVQILTTLPEGADWRDRRIGIGDPLSILTLAARRWIVAQGLADKVRLIEAPTAGALAVMLERGDVDAIVVSSVQRLDLKPLQTLPALRALTLRTIHIPAWLGLADAPAVRRQTLQAALLSYRAPENRGTAATSVWHLPDAALLARYDDLAAEAEAVLAGRR